MTYLLKTARKSINAGLNIYKLPSNTAPFADSDPVIWSTTLLTHATIYNFSITFNGTTFTIPSDGKVYIFEAALTWKGGFTSLGEISYQFYNTTTSTWVGSIASQTAGAAYAEGRTGSVVADEVARYATSSAHDLQLRLKSSANSYASLTSLDGSAGSPYYSAARMLVYRYY